MYGYIYITENLINGKKYIGQHKSEKFDPNYKGSGTYLCHAIDKYGWENFKVTLLIECSSLEELNQAEKDEIERRDAVNSPDYYNLIAGGQYYSTEKCDTEEYRKCLSERLKGPNNPFYGKHHTEECIERQKMSRRKRYEEDPMYRKHISDGQKGKHHSGETKKKMSVSISKGKQGKVCFNNGIIKIYRDPSEAEELYKQGFQRGDLPHRSRTPEEVLVMKEKVTGLICVTDEVNLKRVHPEDVEIYLNLGWRLGRPHLSQESIEKMKETKRQSKKSK